MCFPDPDPGSLIKREVLCQLNQPFYCYVRFPGSGSKHFLILDPGSLIKREVQYRYQFWWFLVRLKSSFGSESGPINSSYGSGSCKKCWILADADPQHWVPVLHWFVDILTCARTLDLPSVTWQEPQSRPNVMSTSRASISPRPSSRFPSHRA
jgi:hypothetical protein